MQGRVTLLLVAEFALFALASLAHAGILLTGFEHERAAIAESVIAAVLATGLAVSRLHGTAARRAAITAQAFALLGTIVGAIMIAIGIGPQTPADIALHAVMLAMLVYGLFAAISV